MPDKRRQISLKIAENAASICQEMQETFDDLILISYCLFRQYILDHARVCVCMRARFPVKPLQPHQCIYRAFVDTDTVLKWLPNRQ